MTDAPKEWGNCIRCGEVLYGPAVGKMHNDCASEALAERTNEYKRGLERAAEIADEHIFAATTAAAIRAEKDKT